MIYKRGDKVVVKRGENFIDAKIIKVVKPYHGKAYYSTDEIKYFCMIRNGRHSLEVMTETHLESDLVNWLKQKLRIDKLKELEIC